MPEDAREAPGQQGHLVVPDREGASRDRSRPTKAPVTDRTAPTPATSATPTARRRPTCAPQRPAGGDEHPAEEHERRRTTYADAAAGLGPERRTSSRPGRVTRAARGASSDAQQHDDAADRGEHRPRDAAAHATTSRTTSTKPTPRPDDDAGAPASRNQVSTARLRDQHDRGDGTSSSSPRRVRPASGLAGPPRPGRRPARSPRGRARAAASACGPRHRARASPGEHQQPRASQAIGRSRSARCIAELARRSGCTPGRSRSPP